MAKPKKNMSFDGMVKFFLQYYRIPTRKDIEKLMDRIDQLEKLIKVKWAEAGKLRGRFGDRKDGQTGERDVLTASDRVEQVVREAGPAGLSFGDIKEKTGFPDKKLRNIIFRLNKNGRIQRKARGIYTV
jgi:predicted Rossmann fold nucleotide-binding protein DprA/Smf involved in DNA uptake